jgi:hypothetical protein
MAERTCYNCKHSLCFLKEKIHESVYQFPGLGIVDVDSGHALEKRVNLFKALAELCIRYKPKED